ncbi:MAG: ribonuclease III [Desulfuromonadales bacterium]|nr:ribonuclease III [Desulfuromonadales bacterium]
MNEVLSRHAPAWEALEGRILYHFVQRELLREAMTHSSFANEAGCGELSDYERLEFLGDAVLDLVISQCLLRDYPHFNEGDLTRLRAEVVAEPGLAGLARQLQLGECLLLGRGEELSGGRDKTSLLADTLESLFGAVFTDGGFDRAAEVLEPLLVPLLKSAASRSGQDYKTRLQEYYQARQGMLPVYHLAAASGPDHQRRYTVEVLLDGELFGSGEGPTKKKAEQEAARCALAALGE